MSNRVSQVVMLCCVFLILVSQNDCAKNPATGKRQFVLITESQEIAMGKESHPMVMQEFGAINDEKLQNYVNALGQQLAAVSHRPELEWHFTVVDSPVVNAFAIPGGYVYITRQILSYMNNEAELAGVLGHEIGHITARHSVAQMSKAQLVGMAIGVGGVFSETFRQFSDLAQMGAGLLFLKFGRNAERESDELGVYYMLEADYDGLQMSHFFEVFQRMRDESGSTVPGWLQTHPVPESRIADTREIAEDLIAVRDPGPMKVNQQQYLSQLENLVFGENPREGFTRDGHFYHPEMRFQIDVPDNWKTSNSRSSVLFIEPNQTAGVRLTLAPGEAAGSPDQAARLVSEQSGVPIADMRQLQIHGNPASLVHFQGYDQSGAPVEALGAFISYRGQVYALMGMGSQEGLQQNSASLRNVLQSFRELEDPKILNLQPDRVHIHSARQGQTLQSIVQTYKNSNVTVEDLAALNRMEPNERLAAGTLVKVVRQ